MSIRGIDVSNRQGVIDWQQVADAGYAWAGIKATEGVRFVDAFLDANLAGARKYHIVPVLYHFALPAWNAPADEAHHFLDTIAGRLSWGEPTMFDLDPDPYGRALPADTGPWAEQYLAVVRATLPPPLLYTNLDIITHHGINRSPFDDCGLWLAAPGDANAQAPAPWTALAAQQTSWTGQVPGIAVPADLDEFFGTVDQLRAYGQPAPALGQRAFDLAARLELVGYIAGGSGPADITAWLKKGFRDGQ